MNKKKIISFLLVIIWMLLIFLLSSMNSNKSNEKSMNTIDTIINNTLDITNGTGLTDKHPTQKKKQSVIESINKPLRKVAHASVYFVLLILVINLLRTYNMNLNKSILIAIIICFIYAITDEYHQTFVEGRTGQFSDVLIDTLGAIIGAFIYKILNIIFIKIKKKNYYKIT